MHALPQERVEVDAAMLELIEDGVVIAVLARGQRLGFLLTEDYIEKYSDDPDAVAKTRSICNHPGMEVISDVERVKALLADDRISRQAP